MWWVKSHRAMSVDDYESWVEGGTVPTLNGMDNSSEAYATVLAFYSTGGTRMKTDENVSPPVEVGSGVEIPSPPAVLVQSPTITSFNMDSRSPQSTEQTNIVNAVHSASAMVRRLLPVECERLQGFPDNWTDQQPDSTRYRQLGNAVAVPVVDWIIQGILEASSE